MNNECQRTIVQIQPETEGAFDNALEASWYGRLHRAT